MRALDMSQLISKTLSYKWKNWGKEELNILPKVSHHDRAIHWETYRIRITNPWLHHKRKWRLNVKSKFFVFVCIKSKFFRDLNLKSLASFLKEELTLYSEHLHSSFISTFFNSSLNSNNLMPCHIISVNSLVLGFSVGPSNCQRQSLCLLFLFTHPKFTHPNFCEETTDDICLCQRIKEAKCFPQLKEFHLSSQSDDAGWTELFHLITLPPTI